MSNDENGDDTFILALEQPITPEEIGGSSKNIRKQNKEEGIGGGNKNDSFGMTIDIMKCLTRFENPSSHGIAFLLYGDTWDEEKEEDTGYLRLMDQRCGRKSFIKKEQEFWYRVGLNAFGENVIGHLSEAQFVRTPISTILKRARDMDLSLPWDRLDPVLTIKLLTMMKQDERKPASVRISKVKNARPTPQYPNQEAVKFSYEEHRERYKIGQMVNLIVENLRPSDDFAVIEYARDPFRRPNSNVLDQAQYMQFTYRNGAEVYAFIQNSVRETKLPLGDYGQLEGHQGFCVVTYPRTAYGPETKYAGDPFGLEKHEDLMSVDDFQKFAITLRQMMFHDPQIGVNLTEFYLHN